MKKLFVPLAAIAVLATSCSSGPNRSVLKKTFTDACEKTAKKDLNGMDNIIDEYCDCAGDKVLNTLTDEELKEMDKNPNAIPQSRIEAITQPCLDEFTRKIQAQGVGQ